MVTYNDATACDVSKLAGQGSGQMDPDDRTPALCSFPIKPAPVSPPTCLKALHPTGPEGHRDSHQAGCLHPHPCFRGDGAAIPALMASVSPLPRLQNFQRPAEAVLALSAPVLLVLSSASPPAADVVSNALVWHDCARRVRYLPRRRRMMAGCRPLLKRTYLSRFTSWKCYGIMDML